MVNEKHSPWLLPEGIEEVLPAEASRLEMLRRRLLDTMQAWGYDLVMPPLVEYLESLLTGVGNDLDLQTCKITDQLTGRMMGVRADMTPQVCRIDAHRLNREEPTRLCYMGTVLQARPDGFSRSRAPLQLGAELFGHAGIESDIEIVSLMIELLGAVGLNDVLLDLGHVGVFRTLSQSANLRHDQERQLFAAIQRKDPADIRALMNDLGLSKALSNAFTSLIEMNGGLEVLDQLQRDLVAFGDPILEAAESMRAIVSYVSEHYPNVGIHIDLSELHGYGYQTGVVFAAYIPGRGQEIARGGRYDEVGKIFGRKRPATGFSADLKNLAQASTGHASHQSTAVWAPAGNDKGLIQSIQSLRRNGTRVVQALPNQVGDAQAMACTQFLSCESGEWIVKDF